MLDSIFYKYLLELFTYGGVAALNAAVASVRMIKVVIFFLFVSLFLIRICLSLLRNDRRKVPRKQTSFFSQNKWHSRKVERELLCVIQQSRYSALIVIIVIVIHQIIAIVIIIVIIIIIFIIFILISQESIICARSFWFSWANSKWSLVFVFFLRQSLTKDSPKWEYSFQRSSKDVTSE